MRRAPATAAAGSVFRARCAKRRMTRLRQQSTFASAAKSHRPSMTRCWCPAPADRCATERTQMKNARTIARSRATPAPAPSAPARARRAATAARTSVTWAAAATSTATSAVRCAAASSPAGGTTASRRATPARASRAPLCASSSATAASRQPSGRALLRPATAATAPAESASTAASTAVPKSATTGRAPLANARRSVRRRALAARPSCGSCGTATPQAPFPRSAPRALIRFRPAASRADYRCGAASMSAPRLATTPRLSDARRRRRSGAKVGRNPPLQQRLMATTAMTPIIARRALPSSR